MKLWVADKLICPECVENQVSLTLEIREENQGDVLDGVLRCPACGSRYPVEKGVAAVLPQKTRSALEDDRGYNSPGMLSAYLWSHFCDLIDEPGATDAYRVWSSGFQ